MPFRPNAKAPDRAWLTARVFQDIRIIVLDRFLCSNHRLKGRGKGGMNFHLREIKNSFLFVADCWHKQIEIVKRNDIGQRRGTHAPVI